MNDKFQTRFHQPEPITCFFNRSNTVRTKQKKKKLLHGNMGVLEQNYQGHQSRFLSPYAN